jgi:hypothetical protein
LSPLLTLLIFRFLFSLEHFFWDTLKAACSFLSTGQIESMQWPWAILAGMGP